MSEINMTPFVDVVLVLLVIFMITAPLMYSSVSLRLPKTAKNVPIKTQAKQVILSLTATGEFYLGKNKVLEQEVLSLLAEQMKEFQQDTVFFRASEDLSYGKVANVLSRLKQAGVPNVSLVTEFDHRQ